MADLDESINISSTRTESLRPTSVYDISPENRHGFTTLKKAIEFLEVKYDSHVHRGTQYIAFVKFSEENYQALETRREKRDLPSMRVYYYPSHSTAIIKLTSRDHEIARAVIYQILSRHFDSCQIEPDILQCVGRATQRMISGTIRQPDSAWIPRQTRSRYDFPSFVVELGTSESLHRLRVDARDWLENSNGLTRLVLVVSLGAQRSGIKMERWQRITGPRGMRSECVQEVTIDNSNSTVSNAPLILPLSLMLDDPIQLQLPASSGSIDEIFSITTATLLHFAWAVFF